MNMRRQIASLVICVLLLAGSARAARTWTTQIDTTEGMLNGVAFVSFNNGWSVGDSGVILKTTNAGHAWTSEVSGTTDNLNALFMISSTEGWAVGDSLRLVHYSGGGWAASTIPLSVAPSAVDLNSVFLTGTGTIFASAGSVNYTGNAADYRNMFVSKDGGASWQGVNLAGAGDSSSSANFLQSVFFVNPQVGYACGQNDSFDMAGKIFRTTDEGASWVDISPAVASANISLNDIAFLNTSEGWCIGTDSTPPPTGYVYHTLDGGATWSQQYRYSPAGFRRLAVVSSSDAWVVSNQGGAIYRFDGTSWTQELSLPSSEFFTSVSFVDRFNGWAVGGLRAGGPLRNTYKYVVAPFSLAVDKTIYISSATTEVNVSVSGSNIESDAGLTIEAAAGLVIASYEVSYNPVLAANKINVELVVDPASAEAGTFKFFVTNPSENTGGTASITVIASPSPTQKPSAIPTPEKIFNPSVDSSVNVQVATPPQSASSAKLSSSQMKTLGVVGDYAAVAGVELELIVYNFNTNQIAYRKKFVADPSGYKVITLQKVTDLGLTISEGMYNAIVIHPKFGKIGSGVLVVHYH